MKTYFFALLVLISQISFADSKLTKADLEAYVGAMTGFDQLSEKYPEEVEAIEAESKTFQITDGGVSWAKAMRSAPASMMGEINAVLSANGYSDIEQFTAKASRIMTAMVAVQMDDMEVEMRAAAKEMEGYVAQMRQQGLSEEMIAQIQGGMAEAKGAMAEAEKAQKIASAEDKALIKANSAWLEAQMESFSESDEGSDMYDAE
ncbi:hypothetical protein QWY82_09355 [Simiduia curdlanivorans]|uniref:Uncharacterized protein n=1 Tax=Simiduia curdlanivorans TaxID=1492769 RepID=A0ABV8V6Z4_9GAMM|nr:hypothetical protein [Simiduia curdlanivorans]MDN3639012.1 hypothetical protein [Simiduia curdlanivorans]